MADVTLDAALGNRGVDVVESPARRAVRRLLRRRGAVFGLAVIGLFVLLAVLAPLLTPYDPIVQSWTSVRKPPSWLHWFGTDDVGRDQLARVVYGTRASLLDRLQLGRMLQKPVDALCGVLRGDCQQ